VNGKTGNGVLCGKFVRLEDRLMHDVESACFGNVFDRARNADD
jgi:hypothetical protein